MPKQVEKWSSHRRGLIASASNAMQMSNSCHNSSICSFKSSGTRNKAEPCSGSSSLSLGRRPIAAMPCTLLNKTQPHVAPIHSAPIHSQNERRNRRLIVCRVHSRVVSHLLNCVSGNSVVSVSIRWSVRSLRGVESKAVPAVGMAPRRRSLGRTIIGAGKRKDGAQVVLAPFFDVIFVGDPRDRIGKGRAWLSHSGTPSICSGSSWCAPPMTRSA